MKKLIAAILMVCMVLSLCVFASAEAEYKLGLGVSLNMNSSKSELAQVDATLAGVVLDAEGKIVACRIDCVQDKMDIVDGEVDTAKEFKTKMELGDDYNMLKFSAPGACIAEWYDQAKAFEAYVVGMTGDEVAAIETVLNEEGHNVATDEALLAGCTISIADFKEAVVKACADEQGTTFATDGEFTLGVAANSTADESVAATDDEDGVVKMYSEFAAVVVDGNGVVLAALTDATQPQITIDVDGEIVETKFVGTKRELKEDYNMVKFSAPGACIAEWYIQAKAFTDFIVGMTAADILAMETVLNEEGHQVSTDETLFASCTISIGGFQAVLAKAADNAR